MSSSRSIAAARNRRSGDSQQQQPQISRPGTSIASQSALQSGGNRRIQSQTQQQQQQPMSQSKMAQQQQQQQQTPQRIKLSVSDAVGLITLRLGRVEQILIDQEGAAANGGGAIPDGTQLVDKSVFSSIINRLEAAEAKAKSMTNQEEIIQKLERELKELKNAHFQHEATVKKSLEDIDAAFFDLENRAEAEESVLSGMDDATVNDCEVLESETIDLKTLVQQDLIGI